jgi:hypothetical protein
VARPPAAGRAGAAPLRRRRARDSAFNDCHAGRGPLWRRYLCYVPSKPILCSPHPPSQEDGSWDVNGQLPAIFTSLTSADLFPKAQSTVGVGQTELRLWTYRQRCTVHRLQVQPRLWVWAILLSTGTQAFVQKLRTLLYPFRSKKLSSNRKSRLARGN